MLLLLLLLPGCTDPSAPAVPPIPPPPERPCGPFARLSLPAGHRIVHCAEAPAPNLILEAGGSPAALCAQVRGALLADGWTGPELEAAPADHTVEVTLRRDGNGLTLGCTDVAGSSTATLSIGAAADPAPALP